MNFIIDYPENMIEPRGLHIPSLEDVKAAVSLVGIVVNYVDTAYEDCEDFDIRVNDEVFFHQGKLIDISDTGEGILIHPSCSEWTVETIFEMILHSMFGQ